MALGKALLSGLRGIGRGTSQVATQAGIYAGANAIFGSIGSEGNATPGHSSTGRLGRSTFGSFLRGISSGGGNSDGSINAAAEEAQDEAAARDQAILKELQTHTGILQQISEKVCCAGPGGGGGSSSMASAAAPMLLMTGRGRASRATRPPTLPPVPVAGTAGSTAASGIGRTIAAKGLGRAAAAAAPAAVVLGAYEGWQDWENADKRLEAGEITEREANVEKSGAVGYGTGSATGAIIGAAAGQFLIPVPVLGALVGSVAGSLLGGWLGEEAGEGLADAVLEEDPKALEQTVNQNIEETVEPVKPEENKELVEAITQVSPEVQFAENTSTTMDEPILQTASDLNDSVTQGVDSAKRESKSDWTSALLSAAIPGYADVMLGNDLLSGEGKIKSDTTNAVLGGAAIPLMLAMNLFSDTASENNDTLSEISSDQKETTNNTITATTAKDLVSVSLTQQEKKAENTEKLLKVIASNTTEQEVKTQQDEQDRKNQTQKILSSPTPKPRQPNRQNNTSSNPVPGYGFDLTMAADDLDSEYFRAVYINSIANNAAFSDI